MRHFVRSLSIAVVMSSPWMPVFGQDAPAEVPAHIRMVLVRWETASRRLRPLTDAERALLANEHEGRYSAHEFDVACRLSAPVTADELAARFEWTGREHLGPQVRLTARPRDEIEALFYGEARIVLETATHLPESIEFLSRDGTRSSKPLPLMTRVALPASIEFAADGDIDAALRTVSFDAPGPGSVAARAARVPPVEIDRRLRRSVERDRTLRR
ncbi:MAG: hypothetical protein ACREJB_12370 [Planctomycetaceae bacterium]